MRLQELAGTRAQGRAELWLDPLGNDTIPSPCTIEIGPTGLTYTWSYEGKDHVGRITLADGGATFEDSWHQSTPVACTPLAGSPAILDVHYAYAGDWDWRITLSRRPGGEIVLQMTNGTPWGETARAVRMIFAP